MKNLTLKDLKNEYSLVNDPGDKWASCLGAHFDLCEYLHSKDIEVPYHWEYCPSPVASKEILEPSYFQELFEKCDNKVLINFGDLLHRYANLLRLNGEDY